MNVSSRYLDRATVTSLLALQGFNTLDIECILDLTGPVQRQEVPVWPAAAVERLAARAWWLAPAEFCITMPEAA
ncbi:hypothetical protein [Parvibaculum sp.]|uniref:hypothetical protein n=1 Tax=Parvibaculum sp. TaxID=2024848 RepID=UPI000C3A23DA|nr:hypothetical protein [Parvibaculum sp.]MAM93719.1 hypothetical protein [Parvibaculum sp.]HCX66689.1 hypothetical protein [Rhodobiaceae bacterium]